jgi:proline iminopeptidase
VTSSLHPPGDYVPSAVGRIWCEVEGSGDEVALVVGGGPGVDHSHYHPWFSRLAEGRRVAYYDHPGTGRSERPREYTVELYSSAIEAVCTYVGARRVVLIGLSFGGIPAVAYALARPDAVDRLVLCSAQVGAAGWQAGNIDNVNRELATQFPEAWAQLLALRASGIRSLDDEYQALLTPLLDELEWVDPWSHPPLHRDPDGRFNVEAYRAFIGDDPEWTVGGALAAHEPELEHLKTPTLVTAGRWDRVTPPAIALEIHSRLPNAELAVFERSAHRPWAEEPDAWFSTVTRFLTTRSDPGGRGL